MTGVRFAVFALLSCCSVRAQKGGPPDPIQTLMREGDGAFRQGDYPAARESLEKALRMASQLPAGSALRYDVLKRLTSVSAASGQFAEARHYLEQALAWRESSLGQNDPKIADDLVLRVNFELRTKEFDRALATAQRVQAMHVASYTSDSIPAADDLLRIGQIYLLQQRPNEAVRSLVKAHDIRTRLLGSLDPGLLPVLDRMNEAFETMSGHGSIMVLREALTIREILYGENSPELISTVDGLANAYYTEQMFVAAEPVYLRLLALWEGVSGKDHPMVAVVLDKLVVFYAKEGEPEKAREALARSVTIRARFLAVGLSHQAADEISQKHQEQAKVLYNRALAALGPSSAANEELIVQIKKALADLQEPSAK
jgi:tetratricopeptide (TPR) repeat protein